jgi:hypothetical protein
MSTKPLIVDWKGLGRRRCYRLAVLSLCALALAAEIAGASWARRNQDAPLE